MRLLLIWLVACLVTPSLAQTNSDGPTDEKAKKTYKEAFGYLNQRRPDLALDSFKKADKQDGGHCLDCQKKIIKYALELQEWKAAEAAAAEMVAQAQGERNVAIAHYQLAVVLVREVEVRDKDEMYSRVHDEFTQLLGAVPSFPDTCCAGRQGLADM